MVKYIAEAIVEGSKSREVEDPVSAIHTVQMEVGIELAKIMRDIRKKKEMEE